MPSKSQNIFVPEQQAHRHTHHVHTDTHIHTRVHAYKHTIQESSIGRDECKTWQNVCHASDCFADKVGYSQNGRNLGDSPTVIALRGNFSSQRSLPHLAKHALLSWFSLPLAGKKASYQRKSLLDIPFSSQCWFLLSQGKMIGERSERTPKTCVCRQPVTVERRLTQVFRKDRTDFDARGDTMVARVPVCFDPQEDFLFDSNDNRTMESWTSAAVPMSLALTTVHYTCTVAIWETRGGRETVTKAKNRKYKTRTAKNGRCWNFSLWGNKGRAKRKQSRRVPPTTAVRVTVQDALQCCMLFWVPHCSLSSIRRK